MRVLIWHVHGSWTTSFVQGAHTYLLPVVEGRGPDGLGRARTWDWPQRAVEVTPEELRARPPDVVVLQRARDEHLCVEWLGLRPGHDLPAVWLEHNAPQGRIAELRHAAADRPELTVVHVTHFNDRFWDCGSTPTRVVEHGVVDPGQRATGELARVGVVCNEPLRRARVVGTDLLPAFAADAPLDVFGMKVTGLADALGVPVDRLAEHEDLPQQRMQAELSRRRVYLHPIRWTSLGLSLLEAMHLGLPVVALAATEVTRAVPPAAGVVSTDVAELRAGMRALLTDRSRAAEAGAAARAAALARYGLGRFLADWDAVLAEAVTGR